MRIAITGAYGSGKTTLVSRLAQALEIGTRAMPAMDGPAGNPGRRAVECTREELVELLVRRLMDRAALELPSNGVVSDGSLIHDWVFVRTMLMHGPTPSEESIPDHSWRIDALEPSRRAIHARMAYDVVVYLPIEFSLEPRRSHPVTEPFRVLSDAYLVAELEKAGIEPTHVTGDLDTRVRACLDAVNQSTPQGATQ